MKTFTSLFILVFILASSILATRHSVGSEYRDSVPDDHLSLPPEAPEAILGDRLFFETRFSQFFFEQSNGDINAKPLEGDRLMDNVPSLKKNSLPGPFRGQSMNCRQCHLGDDFLANRKDAQRTYCDFVPFSPLPSRQDGVTKTSRNAPIMINLGLPREVPILFHFDGEFSSAEELIIETLTGRNFGWLPEESSLATSHIARIIREDNGINPRKVRDYFGAGIPYRIAFTGADARLPFELQIPVQYRIDVLKATDDQVLRTIAKLIHAYMNTLRFGTRNTRRNSASPYDLFLQKNNLPGWMEDGESSIQYTRRLRALITRRSGWKWVTSEDDSFELHDQPYQFGPNELRGLKIFLGEGSEQTHAGNCASCHTLPQFTDYRFHNNGVSQFEYDAIFGNGSFNKLPVPGLAERNKKNAAVSVGDTQVNDRFRAAPSANKPGYADLGAWNIFANPVFPKPQSALIKILCEPIGHVHEPCTPERILPYTIAHFKTPSIRYLRHSEPYFHGGSINTIDEVLNFYIQTSQLARAKKVRNACV